MVTSRDPGNSATYLLSKLTPLVDTWAVRPAPRGARGRSADTLGVEQAVRAGRPFLVYAPTTALGDSGCKVELHLRYEFSSRLLERLVGPVFAHIAATLVDAFVRRADAVAEQGGNRPESDAVDRR